MFDIGRRRAEDFIPGDIGNQRSVLYEREPELSLTVPRGSATCNLNKESGELVWCFYDRLVDFDILARGLRNTREDYGSDSVKRVTLLICAEAQQEGAVQLLALGFDRILSSDPKSALFRWSKKLKVKKPLENK
jgi:hypothetical protein